MLEYYQPIKKWMNTVRCINLKNMMLSEEARFLKDKYSILFMQIKNTQINIIYYLWTGAKVVKVKKTQKKTY